VAGLVLDGVAVWCATYSVFRRGREKDGEGKRIMFVWRTLAAQVRNLVRYERVYQAFSRNEGGTDRAYFPTRRWPAGWGAGNGTLRKSRKPARGDEDFSS